MSRVRNSIAFRRVLSTSLMALALIAVSCAAAEPEPAPVRIGVNLWVGYDLLDVAEVEGFFEDAGAEIEIVDFTSLSDVVAAYQRGQLDGMATTINEVIQVRASGSRMPEIILITDYSNGADVIVAEPGIDSVEDLAGARIAVEAPLGPFILSRALSLHDMSLDDVELVVGDLVEFPGLVADDDADAVVAFPPVSLQLVNEFNFSQIFTTAEIPGQVVDVVSVDKSLLGDRPEVAMAIRDGWDRAMEHLADEPEKVIAALAARESVTPDEMTVLLTEVELLTWAEQADSFSTGSMDAVCRLTAEVLVELDLVGVAEAGDACTGSAG